MAMTMMAQPDMAKASDLLRAEKATSQDEVLALEEAEVKATLPQALQETAEVVVVKALLAVTRQEEETQEATLVVSQAAPWWRPSLRWPSQRKRLRIRRSIRVETFFQQQSSMGN